MAAPIQIDIRAVQAALKAIDKALPKEISKGMKEAAEIVATEARANTPKITGRAAASIKAKGAQRGAAVAFGGPKAPWFSWLDYGGSTKVPGHGRRVSRPFIQSGRYIYPAIASTKDEVNIKVRQLLQRLIDQHGLGGV